MIYDNAMQCVYFVFLLTFKVKDFNDKSKKKKINGENAELGRVSKYIYSTYSKALRYTDLFELYRF